MKAGIRFEFKVDEEHSIDFFKVDSLERRLSRLSDMAFFLEDMIKNNTQVTHLAELFVLTYSYPESEGGLRMSVAYSDDTLLSVGHIAIIAFDFRSRIINGSSSAIEDAQRSVDNQVDKTCADLKEDSNVNPD